MKLLLLAKRPLELGGSINRLINNLTSKGWQIDALGVGGKKDSIEPLFEEARLDLLTDNRLEAPSLVIGKLRPIAEIVMMVRSIIRLKKNHYDLTIAMDPYTLLAASIANLFNKKNPLIYYALELFDDKRLFVPRLFETICKKRFDGLIDVQDDRRKLRLSNLKIDVPSISDPNTCFDLMPALKKESVELVKESAPPVEFIYSGVNHLDRRCIPQMIEAFGSVNADIKLKLILLGNTQVTEHIKRLAKKALHPERFVFVDPVPYPHHIVETYKSHVGIMFYHPTINLNYKYCAPNKFAEFAMLGMPILSSNQDHLIEEIEHTGLGICVNPLEPEQIKKGILSLSDPDEIKTMSTKAKTWFDVKGKYNISGEKLNKWLIEMVEKK